MGNTYEIGAAKAGDYQIWDVASVSHSKI